MLFVGRPNKRCVLFIGVAESLCTVNEHLGVMKNVISSVMGSELCISSIVVYSRINYVKLESNSLASRYNSFISLILTFEHFFRALASIMYVFEFLELR